MTCWKSNGCGVTHFNTFQANRTFMSPLLLVAADYLNSSIFFQLKASFFVLNRQNIFFLLSLSFLCCSLRLIFPGNKATAVFTSVIQVWPRFFGKPLNLCQSRGSLILNNDAFLVSLTQQKLEKFTVQVITLG